MLELIVTNAAESAQLGGDTLAIVHDAFDGFGLKRGKNLFLSGRRTLEELTEAYAARQRAQPLVLARLIGRLLRERPELEQG